MIYSKEVFSKAENEIGRRHVRALADFEKRQKIIEDNAPEIAEVNRRLINTSIEISKIIMNKSVDITSALEKIKEENIKGQQLIRVLLDDFGYGE